MKRNLIIGAVGEPQVGKSTVMDMLAECMIDDGIINIKLKPDDIDTLDLVMMLSKPQYDIEGLEIYNTPNILLSTKRLGNFVYMLPSVNSLNEAKLIESNGGLIIRVRGRANALPAGYEFLNHIVPDYNITNNDSLRRLGFMMRDHYEEIKKLNKWKEAFGK